MVEFSISFTDENDKRITAWFDDRVKPNKSICNRCQDPVCDLARSVAATPTEKGAFVKADCPFLTEHVVSQ
jgi:hypothetical protein